MRNETIIHGERLLEVIKGELERAMAEEHVRASDETEFYLVNLLNDYQTASEVHLLEDDKPLSIIYLEAMSKSPNARATDLKRIGDGTLIGLGFFEEVVHKGLVDRKYYMTIGGLAYDHLAELAICDSQFSDIYAELGAKFSRLVGVLSRIAPWNRAKSNSELMLIYRRWLETGNEKLAELLEKEGIPTEDA